MFDSARLARLVSLVRLLPALIALVLILLPAEVWSQPQNDLVERGFDAQTAYVDEHGGRYVFSPFQVLTNGDWEACPCPPARQLSLIGSDLAPVALSDPEGVPNLGGLSVTVDGRPTRVYAVSPGQVNFFLRADAQPPSSTIALLQDRREIGRQTISIAGASEQSDEPAKVSITPAELRMDASPASQPAVHLVTTPLSFRTSFDAVIDKGDGGRPLQAMVWNPRDFSAVSLVFATDPQRIEAIVSEKSGRVVQREVLGMWAPQEPYHVEVAMFREDRIELSVTDGSGTERTAAFSSGQAPALFKAFRPSFTVISQAGSQASAVRLTNYRLELPHDRFMTARAHDAKIVPIVAAVLALAIALNAPLLWGAARRVSRATLPSMPRLRPGWWRLPALALPAAVILVSIMTLGSHPFDMASQRVWTYLLVNDNLGDIYYRSQTVPLAHVWSGMPFHEAVYPYGAGMSYYFLAVGWGFRLLGGDVSPNSDGLAVAIKVANLAVAAADAALVFALVRGLGARRLALPAAAVFLLNPAMLFDLAVWGETEPVALFFLLASLFAAQRSSSRWAWSLLALAFLGKQTVVLPAVLVGVYYLRTFSWRQTAEGFSVALPVVLFATLPYILAGYPPSIAIDPIFAAFGVFGGGELESVFRLASFDAYSVWPLVTLLQHGQHGLARLQFSDSTSLIGPVSYHGAGVFAVVAIAAGVALWLLTTKRIREPGLIFLVLGFATLAEFLFPTRSIARYLLFPLVFALLATPKAPKGVWFAAGALSITSFIGMYGSVASGLESDPSLAPLLAPENNPVSYAALWLFRSDVMITVGSLLNLAALAWLAIAIWAPRRELETAYERPAELHRPSIAAVPDGHWSTRRSS